VRGVGGRTPPSPERGSLGSGGVALRASTPATSGDTCVSTRATSAVVLAEVDELGRYVGLFVVRKTGISQPAIAARLQNQIGAALTLASRRRCPPATSVRFSGSEPCGQSGTRFRPFWNGLGSHLERQTVHENRITR
jgi:hypothetical protein